MTAPLSLADPDRVRAWLAACRAGTQVADAHQLADAALQLAEARAPTRQCTAPDCPRPAMPFRTTCWPHDPERVYMERQARAAWEASREGRQARARSRRVPGPRPTFPEAAMLHVFFEAFPDLLDRP